MNKLPPLALDALPEVDRDIEFNSLSHQIEIYPIMPKESFQELSVLGIRLDDKEIARMS